MFRLTPYTKGFKALDGKDWDEVEYETNLDISHILFTDGTILKLSVAAKKLEVVKKGPCYISHDENGVYYGKTHLEFIFGVMHKLGG